MIILVRFHGSGVVQGFEIVGSIFFCTRMHIEYFQCRSVIPCFSIFIENNEIIPLIDGE